MDRVLQFRSHLRVECLEGAMFLVGERSHHLLTGPVYGKLAPLVDGRRTVKELVDALEGQVSAPEVFLAVEQLVTAGYLVPASDLAVEAAAFWHALDLDPGQASAAPGAGAPVRRASEARLDQAAPAGGRAEPGAAAGLAWLR